MFFNDHKILVENTIQTLRTEAINHFNASPQWIPIGDIQVVIDPNRNKSEYIMQLAQFDTYQYFGVDFVQYDIIIENSIQALQAELLKRKKVWTPYEDVAVAIDHSKNKTEYMIQVIQTRP